MCAGSWAWAVEWYHYYRLNIMKYTMLPKLYNKDKMLSLNNKCHLSKNLNWIKNICITFFSVSKNNNTVVITNSV